MSAVANASRENAMTKCAPFRVIGIISASLIRARHGSVKRLKSILGLQKISASKKVSMSVCRAK
ncbi:MAG: hypothetical protein PVI85_05225, partial [Methyloceanibacter sp.]|jgi:hypothetical protein